MSKLDKFRSAKRDTQAHDAGQSNTMEEMASQLFGNRTRVILSPIKLESIAPDFQQPRRVVPDSLRGQFSQNPALAFAEWFEMEATAQNTSAELVIAEVDKHLRMESDEPVLSDTGLGDLVTLAASIRTSGLTNAITVVRDGDGYQIETGERRWLAFQLLHYWSADSFPEEAGKWAEIPSQVVDGMDVWRQASENNARTDLNAISRARQLALLLMDTHGVENFKPMRAFEHEQQFYQQVADSDQWRVKYGSGQRLADGIGVKSAVQVRQYRSLLSLPTEAWELADSYNVPEYFLREALKTTESETELVNAIRNYIASPTSESVTAVTNSPEKKPQPGGPKLKDRSSQWLNPLLKFQKDLTPSRWKKLPAGEKLARYGKIKELLARMEELGLDD